MFFNLFGSKDDAHKDRIFKDVVWISSEAKQDGLQQRFNNNPDAIFVAWFPDTLRSFRVWAATRGIPDAQIKEAKELRAHLVKDKTLIFLEHYPLHAKEIALAAELHLQSAEVHGAMDEPIFVRFGSEKMMPLVKLLGFKASEPIEHPYVTSSVVKAQEKMAAQVTVEQSATSLAQWFEYNLPPRT
jgi:hypothetical protein